MLSRILPVLLMTALVTDPSHAAIDPFVGQWKLDPSRSKLTDEMQVTRVGQNEYAFDFGGGKPETIVVDGTDQPGTAGTTLSVAAEGPNWKVIRKKDGRVVVTATWTLSKDGHSLTDDFTSFGQDGSPSNIKYVYKRMAGEQSGFAGTWVSTSEAVNSVFTIQIGPYEDGGLSITTPGGTTNVEPHGKSESGGKSAQRLNAHAVEIVHQSKGEITQTQQFTLSADLETLTLTIRAPGRTQPNTLVFERQ
jgi:hypothetical protein